MKITYLNQEVELLHGSDNVASNPSKLPQLDFLEYVRSLGLGGSYIDIGPNFGVFGVYFSLFCKSEKVYCYDLEQSNISDAQENISRNNLDQKCSLELLQKNGGINDNSLRKLIDVSVISLQGNAIPSEFLNIFRRLLLGCHPVVFISKDLDEMYARVENVLGACGYIEKGNALKETNFSEFVSANYEHKKYFDVSDYWESRYQSGRDSGSGSYGRLAKFKSKFINNFIAERGVKSIVELGCGDGAQLGLAQYPRYIGLDISPTVITVCNKEFLNDPVKEFFVYDPENFNANNFCSDLSISLDVIYHLSNDEIYFSYLRDLFSIGTKYVIIFSNSTSSYHQGVNERSEYVRFRDVLSDVAKTFDEWKLIGAEPNIYPFNLSIPDETSFADFFIFEKNPREEDIYNDFDQFLTKKTVYQLVTNAEQTDLLLRENGEAQKFAKSMKMDLSKESQEIQELLRSSSRDLSKESQEIQELLKSIQVDILEEVSAIVRMKDLEQKLQLLTSENTTLFEQLAVSESKRKGHFEKLQLEREKTERLKGELENLSTDLSNAEATVYKLYHSLAYQFAVHIRNMKTVRGIFRFPLALLRLYRTYRRRKKTPFTSLKPEKRRKLYSRSKEVEANSSISKRDEPTPSLKNEAGVVGWPNDVKDPNKLNVLAIMDEFTSGCFAADVNLIQPRPDNWKALFDKYQPAFVFIESAWKGNFSSWQYRVGSYSNKPGNEIKALASYAKKNNTPVIFWNKEDPVHHNKFIEAAREVDIIFTTDEHMIPSYKKKTGISAVYSLPFAAQPKLHKPLPLQGRLKKSCFAGSWYGDRHAERGVAMEWLLDASEPYGLDIYDRNFGSGIYPFPDKYAKNVKGSLPYNQLCSEYGRYRVFLNVNSVTDSSTMFSRRVFELLASGTPVVSTYAKGIENLLGSDAVWLVRNMAEAQEAVTALLKDDEEWRRRSIAGIRKVFSSHTYAHRLEYICEKSGLKSEPFVEPSVLLMAVIREKSELDSLIHILDSQTWKFGDIVVELKGGKVKQHDLPSHFKNIPSIGNFSNHVKNEKYKYVSVIDPVSSYDENFLQDLVNATRYCSDAYAWGKSTGELEFTQGGEIYRYASLWRIDKFDVESYRSSSERVTGEDGVYAIDKEGFSLNV